MKPSPPPIPDDIRGELAGFALARATSRDDVPRLIAEAQETWHERAAIREYLGGMPRAEAEAEAVRDAGEVMGLRFLDPQDPALPAHARKPKPRRRP